MTSHIKWSFDSGYSDGENIRFLIDKKIDAYIPVQTKGIENQYDKSNFIYDKEKDEYVCPEGKSLIFFSESFDTGKNKLIRKYRGVDCKIHIGICNFIISQLLLSRK